MGSKAKTPECCERYKRKRKACDDCPVMAALSKKERQKLLAKHRKS